ncbi:MAG: hypothetical protein JWN60_960 [Acidobacteria bacterium]|jgi:hypothetical protein|nr:hypothetical protein [Acidobacteriota bacterium]
MRNLKTINFLTLALVLSVFSLTCFAQSSQSLLKRTTYKSDSLEFGAGGTVSIIGAPKGSLEIEGWDKNELEISAEIEVEGATEADLAKLADVNGFVLDDSFGHVRIISVGTHDKDYMKRTAKKFPKNLIGMPFRIDYKIKVPRYCDINIDGGDGDLSIANVDGSMQIKYLNSNAKFNLVGGAINATIGGGSVDVNISTRGWRGRFADIQLATGTMNVRLPLSFNAQIDASILRTGQIENTFAALKPLNRAKFTDKSIIAKAGVGGVPLSFTVGDGTLKISELKKID